MKTTLFSITAFIVGVTATVAAAQPADRGPWFYEAQAGVLYQPKVDMDGSGAFTMTRWTARAGVIRMFDPNTSVGIAIGGGSANYDFSDEATLAGQQPWDRIDDYRFSVPIRFGFGETGKAIVVPSVRYYGESGARWQDATTYGLIAGASWQVSPTLRLGPGFGVFSTLEDGTYAFPILVIDWSITDKLQLSTGQGLGASQGPGLSLDYQATKAWSIGLAARYEKVDFRLDDDGPVPGGVGQNRNSPVVATVAWNPNPGISVSAFAGMQYNGRLSLQDSDGDLVDRRDYDNTPIFGGTFRLRF